MPKNKNKHNGVIQYHQFIFSYQKNIKNKISYKNKKSERMIDNKIQLDALSRLHMFYIYS